MIFVSPKVVVGSELDVSYPGAGVWLAVTAGDISTKRIL